MNKEGNKFVSDIDGTNVSRVYDYDAHGVYNDYFMFFVIDSFNYEVSI